MEDIESARLSIKGLGNNIGHASGIFSCPVNSSGGTTDFVTPEFIPVRLGMK